MRFIVDTESFVRGRFFIRFEFADAVMPVQELADSDSCGDSETKADYGIGEIVDVHDYAPLVNILQCHYRACSIREYGSGHDDRSRPKCGPSIVSNACLDGIVARSCRPRTKDRR